MILVVAGGQDCCGLLRGLQKIKKTKEKRRKKKRKKYSFSMKAANLNGTGTLKKCKQSFEYQQLLLLRDTWWSKF